MDMPDKIFAHEVDKNTVYMSGASPVNAYDRQVKHPRLGLAKGYVREDITDGLARAIELILNSDMAMREEDEGEISTELAHARAALANYRKGAE